MRKNLLIALALLCFISLAKAQIDLGSGIVSVEIKRLPILKFYKNKGASQPERTISVIKDAENEYVIKDQTQVSDWFEPEGLWLDYSIFILRCKTEESDWCEVYINNTKGQTLWIQLDSNTSFNDWSTFLKSQATSITPKQQYILPIKESPSEGAKQIRMIQKEDCFEVLQVKGDWVQIRTHTVLECSQSTQPIKVGWVKWKANNKLLIEYGLAC